MVPVEETSGIAYFAKTDEAAIRAVLQSLETSADPVYVMFFPWADALLFEDMQSEKLRFLQPTFHQKRSDVQIVHQSRYAPSWFEGTVRSRLGLTQGVRKELESWEIIHHRDDTETWRYHRHGGSIERQRQSP
jgi:hypothetical protein